METKIIKTGSRGNAEVYDDKILIDCGVSFKEIKPYLPDLEVILISHIHSDHLNIATLKSIQKHFKFKPKKPIILGNSSVAQYCKENELDITTHDLHSNIKIKTKNSFEYTIKAIRLYHDVPNYGYLIERTDEITNSKFNMCRITDTNTLEGIKIPKCDKLAIELNYNKRVLELNSDYNSIRGQFDRSFRVENSHLRDLDTCKFALEFLKQDGEIIFLHSSDSNLITGLEYYSHLIKQIIKKDITLNKKIQLLQNEIKKLEDSYYEDFS